MNEYTASNGIRVRMTVTGFALGKTDGGWDSHGFMNMSGSQRQALAEAFRHEEDERLGRWRWPENPDYVVYPDGTSRLVVRESDGRSISVSLHDREVMTTYLDSYLGAARAYDDAHPEPTPWHEAKDGEAWIVTVDGEEIAPVVNTDAGFARFIDGKGTSYGYGYVEGGRRIWPEAVES